MLSGVNAANANETNSLQASAERPAKVSMFSNSVKQKLYKFSRERANNNTFAKCAKPSSPDDKPSRT
ncbi:hypothetical protein GCM10007895_15540 [Paraferrimonas sedimenticola]|uniref:Uncharacterized protein n=2 Tax=Paraferrimonas sedimenticola TaxID=375674 RepID=A0AA37RW72_9GAMM|nr:hypothetical protein GCM10007895_15540 [Paraferrimonas sedimenticola]